MYKCITSWTMQCGCLSINVITTINVIITMMIEAASLKVFLSLSLKLSLLTSLMSFNIFAISDTVSL